MDERTPQLEDGHFHIANALFEAIIRRLPCRVPGPILIFLAVMRETYGFNRKSAEISTKRFKDLTGIGHRNNIYRSIKEAVECNLIIAIKNDGRTNPTYSIQKNYNNWKPAIKNDCAIKNDGTCNQKRLHHKPGMIADCILKTPFKDTSKDTLSEIPEDFSLTPGLKAFALKKGISESSVQNWFDAFVNKYKANGDKKKNWAAAWFAYISAVATNPKNRPQEKKKRPPTFAELEEMRKNGSKL